MESISQSPPKGDLNFKIKFNDEPYNDQPLKVVDRGDLTYKEFCCILENVYGFPQDGIIGITYVDEDLDEVSVGSDEEFKQLLKSAYKWCQKNQFCLLSITTQMDSSEEFENIEPASSVVGSEMTDLGSVQLEVLNKVNDMTKKLEPLLNAQSEPPAWFKQYMSQFKGEILQEVKGLIKKQQDVQEKPPKTKSKHHADLSNRAPSGGDTHRRLEKLSRKERRLQQKMSRKTDLAKLLKLNTRLRHVNHEKNVLISGLSEEERALWKLSVQQGKETSGGGAHRAAGSPYDAREIVVSGDAWGKVKPGASFEHTWSIVNCGQLPWTEETTLNLVSRPQGLEPAAPSVPCPRLKSGEAGQIRLQFRAPRSPGTYSSVWSLAHRGAQFGQYLSCVVAVDATEEATGPAALQAKSPEYISSEEDESSCDDHSEEFVVIPASFQDKPHLLGACSDGSIEILNHTSSGDRTPQNTTPGDASPLNAAARQSWDFSQSGPGVYRTQEGDIVHPPRLEHAARTTLYSDPAQENGHSAPQRDSIYPDLSQENGHAAPQRDSIYPDSSQENGHSAPQRDSIHPDSSQENGHSAPQRDSIHPDSSQENGHSAPQRDSIYPDLSQEKATNLSGAASHSNLTQVSQEQAEAPGRIFSGGVIMVDEQGRCTLVSRTASHARTNAAAYNNRIFEYAAHSAAKSAVLSAAGVALTRTHLDLARTDDGRPTFTFGVATNRGHRTQTSSHTHSHSSSHSSSDGSNSTHATHPGNNNTHASNNDNNSTDVSNKNTNASKNNTHASNNSTHASNKNTNASNNDNNSTHASNNDNSTHASNNNTHASNNSPHTNSASSGVGGSGMNVNDIVNLCTAQAASTAQNIITSLLARPGGVNGIANQVLGGFMNMGGPGSDANVATDLSNLTNQVLGGFVNMSGGTSEANTQTNSHMHAQTNTHTNSQAHVQTEPQTHAGTNRQAHAQTNRGTNTTDPGAFVFSAPDSVTEILQHLLAAANRSTGEQSTATPRSTGEQSTARPRSTGEQSTATPRSTGEQSTATPRSTGEQSTATPRSTGEQSTATPRSTGEQSTATSRSTGEQSTATPRSTGEQSTARPRSTAEQNSGSHVYTRVPQARSSHSKAGNFYHSYPQARDMHASIHTDAHSTRRGEQWKQKHSKVHAGRDQGKSRATREQGKSHATRDPGNTRGMDLSSMLSMLMSSDNSDSGHLSNNSKAKKKAVRKSIKLDRNYPRTKVHLRKKEPSDAPPRLDPTIWLDLSRRVQDLSGPAEPEAAPAPSPPPATPATNIWTLRPDAPPPNAPASSALRLLSAETFLNPVSFSNFPAVPSEPPPNSNAASGRAASGNAAANGNVASKKAASASGASGNAASASAAGGNAASASAAGGNAASDFRAHGYSANPRVRTGAARNQSTSVTFRVTEEDQSAVPNLSYMMYQLLEMGYVDTQVNKQILEECGYNVDAATHRLAALYNPMPGAGAAAATPGPPLARRAPKAAARRPAPESKFERELDALVSRLVDMGFDDVEENLRALVESKCELSDAVFVLVAAREKAEEESAAAAAGPRG